MDGRICSQTKGLQTNLLVVCDWQSLYFCLPGLLSMAIRYIRLQTLFSANPLIGELQVSRATTSKVMHFDCV